MEKNFITAQEANKKAKAYSNVEVIFRDIVYAAEKGHFRYRFMFISHEDIAKLKGLGYTVTTDNDEKLPYTVSWE